QVEDRFFSVSVVATPGAGELAAIVVFHDITELKRVENMRKDFVSNASHELRTPLTSIKGYTETLLGNEKVLREKGPEMLEVIHKNANSMMRLLEDILQLSRIESEREVLDMDVVDMQEVVSRAWNECFSLAQDKRIDFQGEVDHPCLKVRGDTSGLVQVVRNLFENCIKHVPEGSGQIRLLCADKGNEVWIGVKDNGPGIPVSAQERVFERFYRLEGHRSAQQTRGTGLGLSICRNILRRISGRIWVESPLPGADSGTIVWMALLKADSEE
ncbi:MAG: sensor histidine kinase, partial [Desulfonatronovibrionaceae bacterium]